MMRLLIILLFIISFLSPAAYADESSEIRALVETNIDAIVKLLQDKNITREERNTRIIGIVNPLFSYQTMAKLSLGKKHWPTLNKQQQSEFTDLFTFRLQRSYLEKLDIYTDEKVLYGDPRVSGGNKAYAPTTLVAKDNEIEILYKFYLSGKDWKIYDVEIGGVSVIQTYRSQFDGVLSEGSVEDLLIKLRTDGEFNIPAPKNS